MNKDKVRGLVEVTAPSEDYRKAGFTELQLGAYDSGYIDSYDEALALFEDHDITARKGKYKWKDR